MFTVTVSFDASGNSSTRSPLPRAYSVMPSTLVTWRGAGATGLAGGGGGDLEAGAGAAGRAGAAGAGAASAGAASDPATRPTTRAMPKEVFTLALSHGASPPAKPRLLTGARRVPPRAATTATNARSRPAA